MSQFKKTTLNRSVILTARYRKQEIADFVNNPLIEALPAILSTDEWFDRLENPVAFDESERVVPAHLRSHFISRLQRFYQPLPRHLELASRIDQILRQGYLGRNPVTSERAEVLQRLYESEQGGSMDSVVYTDYQPILSISLIGASGMGKSTTTERILGRYPQVIYHPEHALHQVVWMKLDCPPDGSIKQLAIDFIFELDRILQTDFHKHLSSRMGTDELLERVKHLAATYSLGILVIDEIQNLSVKKSGGREAMMNFFQELCNTLRVPIMLMGTMKAMRILQLDFRQARRNAAVGSFAWEPMKKDDAWLFLLESLWEYQWLKESVPLTDEFIDLLYVETQGIVAVLSTAFIMAQLRALRNKEETFTKDLFKRVMQKDMAPIQPMLRALRSGDPRRIAQYEDIEPIDIEKMISREPQSILVSELKKTTRRKTIVSSPEGKAIMALTAMGYEEDLVTQAVEKALENGISNKTALVRFVLDELSEEESLVSDDHDEDGVDLRSFASNDGLSNLRKEGVIKGTL